MNLDRLIADLREDEGEKLHGYTDTLGYLTIGVGILIDKRRGGGITKAESAYLLANRIEEKRAELRARLPWFDDLDDARQNALVNMAYQLGVGGLLGFKNSLRLIESGKFEAAATSMRNSRWFRQTPNRAKRVIEQIRTGNHRA